MIKVRAGLVALMLLVSFGVSLPAMAVLPEERLDDPVLEERARGLSAELRCLVCQNQSIDDSDSPFAQDLRRLIRQEISSGQSDDDIKLFLRERYGDYVLLSPPVTSTTLALWVAPFALLGIGILGVALARRGRNIQQPEDETRSHDG